MLHSILQMIHHNINPTLLIVCSSLCDTITFRKSAVNATIKHDPGTNPRMDAGNRHTKLALKADRFLFDAFFNSKGSLLHRMFFRSKRPILFKKPIWCQWWPLNLPSIQIQFSTMKSHNCLSEC